MKTKVLFKARLLIAITAILCFKMCLVNDVNAQPQGGIGINNSNPDTSAILDIVSINRGILIPRMTTTQRGDIFEAATGLLIFNVDNNNFEFNSGTPRTALLHSLLQHHTTPGDL